MSFPRYPKYKASGVEWLGDVPEGWEVKPLRSVFKFSKGLTITKEDLQDEGVHCVNYGEVHSKYGFRLNPVLHPLKCVAPEYLLTNPDALIRDGDFVFADTSEDLEGSGNFTHLWSDNPIFAGYHTIIGRPRKGTSPLLLAYQIHSSAFRSQIQRQVKGVKVFSISQGILKAAKCLLPPLPEQTAIAEFLDRETGKIDELVAEQRRLMELLKEKRQAVISHAVTKGLNPHAPMKPSGIEWLGDVPERWHVRKVSHLFRAGKGKNGQMLTKEFCGANQGDYPVYSGQTENEGVMGTWDQFEFDFGEAGVLFSTTVGAKAMHLRQLFGRFSLSQNCMIIWPTSGRCITRFFYYHFQPLFQWQRSMIPDHMQPSFRMEDLYCCMIALPPQSEQAAIVEFLDTELAKFDTLTAEAQRAIDLLQERRTALISAAVTGQIDVRGVGTQNLIEVNPQNR